MGWQTQQGCAALGTRVLGKDWAFWGFVGKEELLFILCWHTEVAIIHQDLEPPAWFVERMVIYSWNPGGTDSPCRIFPFHTALLSTTDGAHQCQCTPSRCHCPHCSGTSLTVTWVWGLLSALVVLVWKLLGDTQNQDETMSYSKGHICREVTELYSQFCLQFCDFTHHLVSLSLTPPPPTLAVKREGWIRSSLKPSQLVLHLNAKTEFPQGPLHSQ